MNTFYTYRALQVELKKAGLPSSRAHLNTLEQLGRIPKNNVLKFRVSTKGLSSEFVRIYSEEDIKQIVEEVRVVKNFKP